MAPSQPPNASKLLKGLPRDAQVASKEPLERSKKLQALQKADLACCFLGNECSAVYKGVVHVLGGRWTLCVLYFNRGLVG